LTPIFPWEEGIGGDWRAESNSDSAQTDSSNQGSHARKAGDAILDEHDHCAMTYAISLETD
jgi:hypothetical protein